MQRTREKTTTPKFYLFGNGHCAHILVSRLLLGEDCWEQLPGGAVKSDQTQTRRDVSDSSVRLGKKLDSIHSL